MTLVLWPLQSHRRNLWFVPRRWATVWSQLIFWAREHWASTSSGHWPWWSQHCWSWLSPENALSVAFFLSAADFALLFRPILHSSHPWGSIKTYWTSWSSWVQLCQSIAILIHFSWVAPPSYWLEELLATHHLIQDICSSSCHDSLAWDHILQRYQSGLARLPIGSSEYDWIIVLSPFASFFERCFLTELVLKFFVVIDTETSMTTFDSSWCLRGFPDGYSAWTMLPTEECHAWEKTDHHLSHSFSRINFGSFSFLKLNWIEFVNLNY